MRAPDLTRPLKVRADLDTWLGMLGLFAFAEQAGLELPPKVYQLGVELATGLFAQLGVACDRCGCTAARPCPGGCRWDPTYALQGVPRCTTCSAGPRILQPGDPAFHEALALLRGYARPRPA